MYRTNVKHVAKYIRISKLLIADSESLNERQKFVVGLVSNTDVYVIVFTGSRQTITLG
jgi:hypothetical protein